MSRPGPRGDTTLTKLFVGGLPYHTTDQTLKDHFDKFGEIEEAVVITDRVTNKSKGYGFVTMKDPDDAQAAIQDANPVIDGRKANVNLAVVGAKVRGGAHPTAATVLPAAYIKQGLIPQLGMPQYFMPTMMPGVAPLQQLPLLQQPQISPTTAAAQYSALSDYSAAAAAYGYPAMTGLDFSQNPAAAAYGMPPQACYYSSIPQTTQLGVGVPYQAIPAETRMQ